MKVNQLSKITNIKPETIRMYRNMGFLNPEQMENGYYDYSFSDFSSLVYLRKLREYGMSLEDIHDYEHSANTSEMVSMLEEEERTVDEQIERLKERQRFIRFEKRHVIESVQIGVESVQLMQSIDEKLDYYGDDVIFHALEVLGAEPFYLTSTSSIRIPQAVLNGEIKDEVIPIQAGIGLYRFMIQRRNMPVPENAVVVPNGVCISQIVSLRNCEEINIKQLTPMMEYAKWIKKPFISDTTGYLGRIRHDKDGILFDFRIRACIEKNEIADPQAV